MGCTNAFRKVPVWAAMFLATRYQYGLYYSFKKRKRMSYSIAFHNVPVWALMLLHIMDRYTPYYCCQQHIRLFDRDYKIGITVWESCDDN